MNNTLDKNAEKALKKEMSKIATKLKKLKFTDVPLVRDIIYHGAEILLQQHKVKSKPGKEQQYVQQLNDDISAIINNFRDVEITEIFIRERLDHKVISKKGVTDPEHIRYHIENYFIRLLKVKDQVCIFLNTYFQLGYKQNSSLEYKILHDPTLVTSGLDMYIRFFTESISKLKDIRNVIAHRANFQTSDLAMMDALLLRKKLTAKDRRTYFQTREFLIRYFAFVSEANRKNFYSAVVSMFIILDGKYAGDYERFSGLQVPKQQGPKILRGSNEAILISAATKVPE